MATAKLFWNGRSQAVRLPKEFRFAGDEVEIHREGNLVILEAKRKKAWPKNFFNKLGTLSDDFEIPKDSPPPPIDIDVET